MLQDHSLQVRKTCDTCEKMSYISLSLPLYFLSRGILHTKAQKKAKITPKKCHKISQKNAVAIFFNISKSKQYMRYAMYRSCGCSTLIQNR